MLLFTFSKVVRTCLIFCYFLFLKGAITQLSEQIFTLNDRIDEFASEMDELNSNFSIKRVLSSSQQPEACNGSASTSYLTYDPRNGSALLSSSSSSQLAKETAFMEEVR